MRLEYLTHAAPHSVCCCLQVVYAYNANETTHSESEIPWYQPLCGSFWSISGFRQTHLGRVCTHGLVCTMELLRIAPKGSAQVGVFRRGWPLRNVSRRNGLPLPRALLSRYVGGVRFAAGPALHVCCRYRKCDAGRCAGQNT